VLVAQAVCGGSDFFELGGDSLKATLIVEYLDEQLGVYVDPIEIFENPKFDDFCAVVGAAFEAERSSQS
jgi:hypothetical protein